jgi:hypothetical protein
MVKMNDRIGGEGVCLPPKVETRSIYPILVSYDGMRPSGMMRHSLCGLWYATNLRLLFCNME